MVSAPTAILPAKGIKCEVPDPLRLLPGMVAATKFSLATISVSDAARVPTSSPLLEPFRKRKSLAPTANAVTPPPDSMLRRVAARLVLTDDDAVRRRNIDVYDPVIDLSDDTNDGEKNGGEIRASVTYRVKPILAAAAAALLVL
jgi:hypothetical protein